MSKRHMYKIDKKSGWVYNYNIIYMDYSSPYKRISDCSSKELSILKNETISSTYRDCDGEG